MVGIVLTPEQIRAAPAEVRQWLRGLIETDFAIAAPLGAPPPGAPPARAADPAEGLAACSPAEAAGVLRRLQGDHAACQVFFELGRAPAPGWAPGGPLHRIALGELARHCRIPDGGRLVACLEAINQAFQAERGDAGATLFGFDEQGACYIRRETHDGIRELWDALAMAGTGPASGARGEPAS